MSAKASHLLISNLFVPVVIFLPSMNVISSFLVSHPHTWLYFYSNETWLHQCQLFRFASSVDLPCSTTKVKKQIKTRLMSGLSAFHLSKIRYKHGRRGPGAHALQLLSIYIIFLTREVSNVRQKTGKGEQWVGEVKSNKSKSVATTTPSPCILTLQKCTVLFSVVRLKFIGITLKEVTTRYKLSS